MVTKLPGTVNGSPYTNSADDACKSCLGADRMPNKSQCSSSIQFVPDNLAFRDVFMVLWKRSTKPFAFGFKAVVRGRCTPSDLTPDDRGKLQASI